MVVKYLLILFGLCLMACNRQSIKQEEKTDSNTPLGYNNQSKEVNIKDTIIPDEYAWKNRLGVFFRFDQPVNGYTVKGMFFPKQEFPGNALLYFSKGDNNFVIHNECFGNDYLDKLSENTHGSFYNEDIITLKYTRDKEFLSGNAPFFFQDVNFDGEAELLITNWRLGDRGLYHTYDVYKVRDSLVIHLKDEPFINPTGKLNNHNTEFDSIKKQIIIHCYDGMYHLASYTYELKSNQFKLIEKKEYWNNNNLE